ncbi:RNA polymerase II mediator complex subunit MED8 [Aspergillus clavatus NRRL 1]|uniref:Mediator of RNA polymerase II transcription subunit 8 n=1 Tax=Aspergillus clavatus (strain ATCC 1007 / CBS 513.65 / DSM 816 / NCTC 3887 / NRRL 1 / QM 1276 / 107) TaxID=344612 RepID=MED8_ASPCL|nr:RNA polymerase II mediator complex component Med8, putative [Aspergillus clavatus NRRL 1]A1CHE9.1 RecName: Full=Mediator of RNA polymerase II transcription subunit 8; AltName: Full=Mediator complex subunit 8 [Aspergillus clavatus NRRL 1]EAW10304.1 RNA polymerase II mediator complex component Med8, putative [Aspergillus clavatus NRRL 1]
MASPSQDQIKVLEQSRQRLVQLTRSLGSLIGSLNQSDPLPSWSSLQSQASIISNNLLSVSEHLSDNCDLLSALVAYPGPEYPGRTQASTLEQLLRTKLDPRIEDWVARGRRAGASALEDKDALSETELAELWDWAPVEANQEARRRNWGGDYTLEEREMGIQNVVTGLRRQLEDDERDEDEDEDDEEEEEGEGEDEEMEVVGVRRRSDAGAGLGFDTAVPTPASSQQVQKGAGPVVPLDDVLRFMTTGTLPQQR